jgi:hypothetical protein
MYAADGAHLVDIFANDDTAQLLVVAGELDIDPARTIEKAFDGSIC